VDREENEPFSFGEVKPKRSLEATNLRLKLCYFGHVMRAKGSLLGQVAGYMRQGKLRMRWFDSMKEAIGLHSGVLKEAVQDRKIGACWWRKRLGTANTQM